MSRRSPAKLPALQIPKHPASTSSYQTLPAAQQQSQSELSMAAAVEQVKDSLANLDFTRLFKIFPRRTPLYRYLEKFDFSGLIQLALKAYPKSIAGLSKQEVEDVKDAKTDLIQTFLHLDKAFEQMENAGLDVGNIRSTLAWARKHIRETRDELEGGSHHSYSNPLPAEPTQDAAGWASNQYLEIPPTIPSPTSGTFPEVTYPTSVAVPQHGSPSDAYYTKYNPPHVPEPKGPASLSSMAVGYGTSPAVSYSSSPNGPPYTTYRTPKTPQVTRKTPHPMSVRNADDPTPHWNARSYNSPAKAGKAQDCVNVKDDVQASYFDAYGSRSSAQRSPRAPNGVYHAPMYHHPSTAPSPPHRHEGYPVLLPSQGFSVRSHHRPAYDPDDDENVPFIPPHPSYYSDYHSASTRSSMRRH